MSKLRTYEVILRHIGKTVLIVLRTFACRIEAKRFIVECMMNILIVEDLAFKHLFDCFKGYIARFQVMVFVIIIHLAYITPYFQNSQLDPRKLFDKVASLI